MNASQLSFQRQLPKNSSPPSEIPDTSSEIPDTAASGSSDTNKNSLAVLVAAPTSTVDAPSGSRHFGRGRRPLVLMNRC